MSFSFISPFFFSNYLFFSRISIRGLQNAFGNRAATFAVIFSFKIGHFNILYISELSSNPYNLMRVYTVFRSNHLASFRMVIDLIWRDDEHSNYILKVCLNRSTNIAQFAHSAKIKKVSQEKISTNLVKSSS